MNWSRLIFRLVSFLFNFFLCSLAVSCLVTQFTLYNDAYKQMRKQRKGNKKQKHFPTYGLFFSFSSNQLKNPYEKFAASPMSIVMLLLHIRCGAIFSCALAQIGYAFRDIKHYWKSTKFNKIQFRIETRCAARRPLSSNYKQIECLCFNFIEWRAMQ